MIPISIYAQAEKVSPESFLEYFKGAKQSAFRLELLPSYLVDEEINPLREFTEGKQSPPPDFNKDWISLIHELTGRGVIMQRVRLFDEPTSDYLKFELSWGYSLTVPAGEEVRVIERVAFDSISSSIPITQDFWLFDENICLLLEYDFTGRFLGLERLPRNVVGQYSRMKKVALEKSQNIQSTPYWTAIASV